MIQAKVKIYISILYFIFTLLSCKKDLIPNKYDTHFQSEMLFEVSGKYTTHHDSPSNRYHYAEITIKNDSSFIFYERRENFIKTDIEGYWNIIKDTLILNGKNNQYKMKMTVMEEYDSSLKKGEAIIHPTYYSGYDLNYVLKVRTKKHVIELKNKYGATKVSMPIDEFCITNSSSLKYPAYKPKNKNANFFTVELSPQRLFLEEKWLMRKGRIQPKGIDGEYVKYYLTKEEEH